MSSTIKRQDAVRMAFNVIVHGRTCVHCGQSFGEDSYLDQQLRPIRSGVDYPHELNLAHASCFFKHEADQYWKEANPESGGK